MDTHPMTHGPAGSPTPPPRREPPKRIRKPVIVMVVLLALVAGAALSVAGLATMWSGGAKRVALESVNTAGAAPFLSEPVGADEQGLTGVAGVGGNFGGNTAGLYGSSGERPVCDAATFTSALQADPAKAAAWSEALGMTSAEIPYYVAGLSPVVLRSDTAVTVYGWEAGTFVPYPAVLQTGTAVFINAHGEPKVKCFSGNPLARPVAAARRVDYAGPMWPAFTPEQVTVIDRPAAVLQEYTTVDVRTNVTQTRVSTSAGPDDRFSFCEKFTEHAKCASPKLGGNKSGGTKPGAGTHPGGGTPPGGGTVPAKPVDPALIAQADAANKAARDAKLRSDSAASQNAASTDGLRMAETNFQSAEAARLDAVQKRDKANAALTASIAELERVKAAGYPPCSHDHGSEAFWACKERGDRNFAIAIRDRERGVLDARAGLDRAESAATTATEQARRAKESLDGNVASAKKHSEAASAASAQMWAARDKAIEANIRAGRIAPDFGIKSIGAKGATMTPEREQQLCVTKPFACQNGKLTAAGQCNLAPSTCKDGAPKVVAAGRPATEVPSACRGSAGPGEDPRCALPAPNKVELPVKCKGFVGPGGDPDCAGPQRKPDCADMKPVPQDCGLKPEVLGGTAAGGGLASKPVEQLKNGTGKPELVDGSPPAVPAPPVKRIGKPEGAGGAPPMAPEQPVKRIGKPAGTDDLPQVAPPGKSEGGNGPDTGGDEDSSGEQGGHEAKNGEQGGDGGEDED